VGPMVAPVGPMSLTWRHGLTSGSLPAGPTIRPVMTWRAPCSHRGSHPVDVSNHQDVVPSMGPTLLTWRRRICCTEFSSDFILFGKKTCSMGAWNPQPIAASTSELPPDHSLICVVVLYVALFVNRTPCFISQKKLKNPPQGGSNLRPVGLEGVTFTTRPVKLLCFYDRRFLICTQIIFFNLSDLMGSIPMIRRHFYVCTWYRGTLTRVCSWRLRVHV